MDESRKAYNLTAFATDLRSSIKKGDRRYEKECSQIELLFSWATIQNDLRECLKAIQTIVKIQLDPDARAAFGQGLMTTAVFRYSRATISRADARSGFNFKGVFSPSNFAKHLAISELRSTVFAHHHVPAGEFGELWSSELMAIRPIDGNLRSIHVFQRKNFTADLATALNELATIAMEAVTSALNRKKAEHDAAITSKIATDPLFKSRLEAHPFDPENFFGYSEDLAKQFWRTGSANWEGYFAPGTDNLLPE